MSNMTTEYKDGLLTIKIKCNGDRTDSSTGKMEMIGTTHGFTNIGQTEDGRNVQLSLNCGVRK